MSEAICYCLQTSTYSCFYQGGEICIETCVHKTSNYMDTFIVIIMYCQRYLLVNNIVYIKKFSGDLPALNICLRAKF